MSILLLQVFMIKGGIELITYTLTRYSIILTIIKLLQQMNIHSIVIEPLVLEIRNKTTTLNLLPSTIAYIL